MKIIQHSLSHTETRHSVLLKCPAVALFIFNRPNATRCVFETIRAARPSQLLVVADGPRSNSTDDIGLCKAAREIAVAVDWPCELVTNFSDKNLGCKVRIATGLSWAFEHVDEAIVLEDDCLPHPSFFNYCAELLEKYRDDARVLSISGDNYQRGAWRGDGSYYFSKYGTCWGWATWQRAWRFFDLSMSKWPEFRDAGTLYSVCPDPIEHEYWYSIFEDMYAGKIDSWAYAWVFAHFTQRALSPHPNRNLISNIGFAPDATHTTGHSWISALPTFDIGEIKHPSSVSQDKEADIVEFDTTHGGETSRRARTFKGRMRKFVQRSTGFVRRILSAPTNTT